MARKLSRKAKDYRSYADKIIVEDVSRRARTISLFWHITKRALTGMPFVMALAIMTSTSCEKLTRVIAFDQNFASEVNVQTSEQEGATSGTVNSASRSAQRITVADGKGIDGANAVFPAGSLSTTATITITKGEDLATAELVTALGLTSFPSKANAVKIASSPQMDTTQPMEIRIPAPAASTLSLLLGGDSNWVVLFESLHAGDGATFWSGVIPRSEFTIENGYAKISAKYFGTYQVVETDPLIATATSRQGTMTEVTSQMAAEKKSPATATNTSPASSSSAPTLTFTSVSASNPGFSLKPTILGTSSKTSSVTLYLDSTCAGTPASAATANATFATTGIVLTSNVGANTGTVIYGKAVDDAGNESTCTNLVTYIHDDIAPTVGNVTSSDTDRSYKAGQSISILVRFYENVVVTGTPRLTLETGTNDAVVDYADGSGTSTLVFTYTVAAGHTSSDLDYHSTSALAFNGGTIKDTAGNNAVLTLPTPGQSGSLRSDKQFVIDTTAPTVTSVTSSTNNGSYKTGQQIFIQVNFSEDVTVTGTPRLTLETGPTDAVVDYTGGSGTSTLTFTYTISSGHTSADLDYHSASALSLNGGTIKDAAGNAAVGNDTTVTLAAPGATNSLGASKAIVIDAISPTISAIAAQSTDLNTPTAAIYFTIGDSGTTLGCNSTYLTLSTSDSSLVTASGVAWSGTYPNCAAVITPVNNGNGTASLTITVNDAAGNTATSVFNLVIRDAYVIGQPSSMMNKQAVMGLYLNSDTLIIGGKLFVADYGNHRILVWNTIPTTNSQAPSFVLGQPDFSSTAANTGGVSGSSLNQPTGMATDGTRLFVSDSANHRVLVWNNLPTMTHQSADFALGQPNLTSNTANNGGLSASSMDLPETVRTDGTRLYVADYNNNRVLVWNSLPTSSGQAASFALGQPDLTSKLANNGAGYPSASSMFTPWGIAISGTKLFVADYGNKRVLAWDTIPTASGQAANFVLGQPNMTSNTANNGGVSGASMLNPANIFADTTGLFVADAGNHRVLVWNTIPTSTGASASFALGQPNLTSNAANNGGVTGSSMYTPYSIFSDGAKLYVNDALNSRVLVWNTMPTTSGQSASFAIGQPDLTSNSPRLYYRTSTFSGRPSNVFSDGTRLVVTDPLMNRVLIYNSIPTSSGQAANVVLGQPDFTSVAANNSGVTGSSLNSPQSAIIIGTKLFVADTNNHRVLVWNTIPTTNGRAADFVLGQTSVSSNVANNGGISGSSLNSPVGLCSDGTKLYVADSSNNRVLVWNSIPTTSSQPASFTLGQPSFTSSAAAITASSMYSPRGIYSYGSKIFVTDFINNRVLIWNAVTGTSGQSADVVLGQPNFTSGTANNGGISASSMSQPQGVYVNLVGASAKLYVSDSLNNRVLIWNTIPTSSAQAADAVFGQVNFTSNSANAGGAFSAYGVYQPVRSFGIDGRLFIPDFNNSRVLVIPAP